MPEETAQKLFQISAEDEQKTLRNVLKDRHSSYDGFISHYSNCLCDWLQNPVTAWDHNELESLLWACLLIKTGETGDESADKITSLMEESCELLYTIFSDSVDWPALEREVKEAREEIEAELRADDPDLELSYRCLMPVSMSNGLIRKLWRRKTPPKLVAEGQNLLRSDGARSRT